MSDIKKIIFALALLGLLVFIRLPSPATSLTSTPASITTSTPPQNSLPAVSNTITLTPPAPPQNFSGRAALVYDMQDQKNIYAYREAAHWPLASLTKLMTAVVVLQNLPLNQTITIPAQTGGLSQSGAEALLLGAGERYSVRDLMEFLLLPSNNQAADVLAAAVGRETFIAQMNTLATQWGMNDTHYVEPSGLSVADESTPGDLQLLAGHIYHDYPLIFQISRISPWSATELNTGRAITVTSINQFANQPGFLGGKTGYTDDAKGNLLSLFSWNGRPILVIVLGTVDRFGETKKLFSLAKK